MTQEELNTILAIHATEWDVFCSLLKDIDMPQKSKEKLAVLLAMNQSFALKLLKENVASELKFPESVNQSFKYLDELKE